MAIERGSRAAFTPAAAPAPPRRRTTTPARRAGGPPSAREAIGQLARDARVGNRGLAKLVGERPGAERRRVVARTPTATAPSAVPEAALRMLGTMGIGDTAIAQFGKGELVLVEIPAVGGDSTIALLQLKEGLLRGGIFSIKVKDNPKAALSAFMRFRQLILNLARALRVPQIELFGAAIHNNEIAEMLRRQGFTPGKEVIPEKFGMGPETEVDVMSKRYPVTTPTEPVPAGTTSTPEVTPRTPAKVTPAAPTTEVPARTPTPEVTPGKLGPTATPGTTTEVVGGEPVARVGPAGPAAEGAAAGGLKVGGALKAGAGFGVQLLVFWWLGKKAAEAEQASRAKLLGEKVEPEVRKALTAQAATAWQLTTERPALPVYLNVTADFDYTWTRSGIGATPSEENVTDIRFISATVSRDNLNEQRVLSEEDDGGGQVETHWATRRITYSVPVDFGETEPEHHWRVVLADAAQVARAGKSARAVGEGTHWGGDEKAWERHNDNERRKWGETTLAEQRAYDARELWVRAYVEYTAFYGPDDRYMAALEYLKEIQHRPRPVPGPVLYIKH